MKMAIILIVLTCAVLLTTSLAAAAEGDPRDNASPWGMGVSAESSGAFPQFNPLLNDAGVKWLRLFPEWQSIEPRRGEWNWEYTDKIVADAKANNLHLIGVWAYFAPWASADGGTRRGPIKDMQYWRDYVRATVSRYKDDIKYWEVWNEFNGSFYEGKNKVKDYADLVIAAYDTVKDIEPDVRIGMSVANFDVNFLDNVIKTGAADHFDFLCVHPYENLGALTEGGEVGFLSLAGNLRDMLKANRQSEDIPLWITEIGYQAPIEPDRELDTKQAEMLVKAYILSIAQDFQRIFWFEVRGPAYGTGTDHGIIRFDDWTPRPAYGALKTMTTLMGSEPKYGGWLNLGNGGYGFLFQGQDGAVMAAWAPTDNTYKTSFASDVRIIQSDGTVSSLAAGRQLTLAKAPVFVSNLPADTVRQAQVNLGKPYPWGGDYANARSVTCRLGAINLEDGLKQIKPETTAVINELTETYRKTIFNDPSLNGEGHYIYFRVDPQFVPYGTKELEVTIEAKRISPKKSAFIKLCYESAKGYRESSKAWTIPADDKWHEYTWKITDANFVGQWGWNFRLDGISSPNDFFVRNVRVSHPDAI